MPQPPALEDLTTLVQDIVGTAEAVPDAGFFEIGGDSLAALELSAAIHASWSVVIGIDAIMTASDLRALHTTVLREIERPRRL